MVLTNTRRSKMNIRKEINKAYNDMLLAAGGDEEAVKSKHLLAFAEEVDRMVTELINQEGEEA